MRDIMVLKGVTELRRVLDQEAVSFGWNPEVLTRDGCSRLEGSDMGEGE